MAEIFGGRLIFQMGPDMGAHFCTFRAHCALMEGPEWWDAPEVSPVHLALTFDRDDAASVTGRTPTSVSDKALFDAILAGDERAAAAVFGRLRPTVEATLERLLGSRQGPQHDVLFRRSLERVISEVARHPHPWVCQLSTWASALTALVALEALRARTSTAPVDVGGARGGSAPDARIEQLRSLIAELPPRHAEVVVLHDVLGLAVTQLAITLGVSIATLKTRLSLGRERLTARLARRATAAASQVIAVAR